MSQRRTKGEKGTAARGNRICKMRGGIFREAQEVGLLGGRDEWEPIAEKGQEK